MGDENPICTLGDYSKPSHEGYMNTIELPVRNKVVPLRSDTIWLVQNECSFHGLKSDDPNQHLKDFLKLVDSLNLDGENRERTCLFTYHGLDLWLQIQIFYDHVDGTIQKGINYATGGRLRKLRPDKAWSAIERLDHYEDEGSKVDTLMKDAISLMKRSESLFRMTTNEMYRPPYEPSRQEEFEQIVMNFILDQEERVKQLEEYMRVIINDFMQLSSKVTRRLKDKIREEGSRMIKIKKITKYPDKEIPEPLAEHKFSEDPVKKTFHDTLKSIPTNPLWIRYVQLNLSTPPPIFKKTPMVLNQAKDPVKTSRPNMTKEIP
ncbi:hypothetical protein Tco_1454810 [Tanacetum coccineum]